MKAFYPFKFLDRLSLLSLPWKITAVVLIYVVSLSLFFYFRLTGALAYTSFAILLIPLLLGSLLFERKGGIVHGVSLSLSVIILEAISNLRVTPGLFQSLGTSLGVLWFPSILIIWVSTTLGYLNYQQRRERETLEKIIYIDSLTGLYNDRYFREQLKEQEARAERYGEEFALLCIDINNFEKAVDAYGLRSGDELLKEFAHLVKSNLRKVDLAFRYVGKNFMVLLPHTAVEGAKTLAERLRQLVEESLFRKR